MGREAIGPHLLRVRDRPQGRRWARAANIVKAVDRDGSDEAVQALAEAQAAHPEVVTVFRPYFSVQDLGVHGSVYAREAVRRCRGFVPTFIELLNEVGREDPDRLLALNAEARPTIVAHGSELAALSGGTGWWERETWLRWAERDYLGLPVVALHAYWDGPWTDLASLAYWNCLRHRLVHEWTGGHHPRFIITEAGRDRLVAGAPAGWRAQGVTAEQYLRECLAYGGEVWADRAYVVGVTYFTNGPTDPQEGEPGFLDFDMDPLVDGLLAAPYERRRLWPLAGGGNDVSVALALVPSNQAYNTGALPDYNEMGGMRWLTENVLVPKFGLAGFTVKPFYAPADPPTSVENIRRAYKEAYSWLAFNVEADVKLCLSLHTDSAGAIGSHSAYCAGREAGQTTAQAPGFRWGELLARPCQRRLETKTVLAFDYSDYLFYQLLKPYTSVLLEICAHSVADPDLRNLYGRAKELGDDLVAATRQFVGGGSPDAEVVQLRADNARLRAIIAQASQTLAAAN